MRIDITPIGKPRQTRSDRWKERPVVMRYREFADKIREEYPGPFPDSVKLVFYIAMPKSWSQKKKDTMRGQPHQQRPDFDNLAKSVCDALLKEDSVIWRCLIEKYWDDKGGVEITPLETTKAIINEERYL